jgi:hypothetical protein
MSIDAKNSLTARASRARRRLACVALVALGAASLAGCAAIQAPSDDELAQLQQESLPYQKKGTGSISGTVAMQSGSQTIPANVGTSVYLTPVTTFATQRLQKFAIQDNELPEQPHSQVAWLARTHEGGGFHFQNLPPGNYYVISQMFWSPPSAPVRGDVTYATVRLAPGESVQVLVTRPQPTQ